MSPISAGPARGHDDEEELELPPLDGVEGDEPPAGEGAHDDHEIDEAPALGEEDGAAFDLDPASELDAVEERGGEGDEVARDAFDLGSIADAIALPDEGPRASDERGLTHDWEDVSPFDAAGSDDDGAGTGEDLAGFVDEGALPPLGEDEADPAPAPGAPWRGRYRVATGLGAEVPCGLVAVSASAVVAAGPAVLVLRDGARMSRGSGPDIDAVAVAATDGAIFVASRKGALLASTDVGETWATAATLSPAGTLGPPAFSQAASSIDLAATPGRLWIRQQGALSSLRFGDGGPEPLVLVHKEGVRAMAAAGSALVIVAERGAELVIERLRGDDEASAPEVLAVRPAEGALVLAAEGSGRAVALLAGGAAHVSRDGGRTFQRCETGPARAVTFVGQGASACAMVIVPGERRAGTPARLLEIDPEGAVTRVAEIAGAFEGPAALAWDPAREVLWVACDAGLLAFERSPGH